MDGGMISNTASGKALRSRKVLARDYFMPIEHARTVPGEVAFGEGEFAPGSKIVFPLAARRDFWTG